MMTWIDILHTRPGFAWTNLPMNYPLSSALSGLISSGPRDFSQFLEWRNSIHLRTYDALSIVELFFGKLQEQSRM